MLLVGGVVVTETVVRKRIIVFGRLIYGIPTMSVGIRPTHPRVPGVAAADYVT